MIVYSKNNEGILCVVFWRSASRFSLADQYQESSESIQHLKKKGIKFIFVSTDHNTNFWKDYINEHQLSNEAHLRIGVRVNKEKYNLKLGINFPQYQLYYNSRLIDYNAGAPHTKAFNDILTPYLKKIDSEAEEATSLEN